MIIDNQSDLLLIENRYNRSQQKLSRNYNPIKIPQCILNLVSSLFILYTIIHLVENPFERIDLIGVCLIPISILYVILIRKLTYKKRFWWNILAISNEDVTLYEDQKVIWHFLIKSLKKVSHSVIPYAKLIKSEQVGYEIRNELQLIPTLEIQFYRPFSTFRLIYPLIGEFEVLQSQLIIAKLSQFENIPKFDKHQFTFDKGLRYSWLVIFILGFILFFI